MDSPFGKRLAFMLILLLLLAAAPGAFAAGPAGNRDVIPGGIPELYETSAAAEPLAVSLDGPAEVWVDDDYTATTPGWGVDHFASIQAGIDAVAAGGTVNVYPGTYNETAASRYLYSNVGPYQFGLFFADEKPGVTVQGLKADGSPVTAYADVAATVTTNATNSFGYSGVFVEADDTTIAGLRIGPNAPSDNKTIEVIGENFTLKNSVIDVPGGGSVYINDWRYDDGTATSYVTKYTVEGNWLKYGGSVDISSGAGVTGPAADRKIINNKFTADGETPYWALVSFNGIVPSVGWFTYPVGGATVTGNDFSGSTQYIRSRGTVAGGFDWASYWANNTFDKAVLATTDGNPANPRAFDYMSGTYLINNTLRIGAAIQPEVDIAQAGDTVNVAPGAYNESPTLSKSLTLKSSGGRDVTTINLQTTPNYTGSLLISGPTVTLDGFTINGFDAVGGGVASTNVYVQYPAANVVVKNNLFKIGQIGTGSTGDDGFGVITAYNTSNAIASLVVTDNIFTPLNAEGRRAYYINPSVTQFTFTGNQITGKFSRSAVSEANNSLIENNTITGVGAAGSRSSGLTVWGYVDPATRGAATFRGNTISGVATAISILSANNVIVEQNTISDVGVGVSVEEYLAAFDPSGVEIHQNKVNSVDTFAVKNATTTTVDAENNWWGSTCPAASLFSGPVDYTPWWTAPDGSTSSTSGVFTIPANATTAEQNAILSCAPPGSTVTYMGNPIAGGVVVNTPGVTINLNGFTVGAGSPAFTINADDVTLQGPGALDGNDVASPAVLVNAGADNFTLKDVEVREWADGVEIAGDVVSLKIVDNFIWDNADAGLQVNSDVNIDGVVNIYGNLFKVNGGNGIQNDGATADLPAQYNSWGDIGGPATGDGVSANVDASNPTYLEYFIDMDPDTLATARRAGVGTSFDVMVKGDARKVNGIAFKVAYDNTVLQLNSATYQGVWAGATCLGPTLAAGSVKGTCYIQTVEWDGDAAPIMKLNFTVLALPSSPYPSALDILHAAVDTNAGAYGGAKVYVNNAGYGLPSVPARDITDTDDGTLTLGNLANYTGFIDLQGRTNDSGATLLAKNIADKDTSVDYASGTSVSSGAYTTAHLTPWMMFQGETFWFQVDRALYLPTTQMGTTPSDTTIPGSWVHSKPLSSIPTTPLLKVVLLGGDGTDDDVIDVLDAGCMGMSYYTASTCTGGAGANSDVNGDGVTDILDLSLMGGNFYKVESPWTP